MADIRLQMETAPKHPSPAVMSAIAQAIRSVRFGMIRIMVHDARIVQIEKIEKIRLDDSAHLTAGGRSTSQTGPDRTSGSASNDDP